MAEIKSTLDIVLEKTKHLVLTPEERLAMERREHLEKVPGIVQRFLDEAWTVEQMTEAWRAIPEVFQEEARREIVRRLLNALSPEETGGKVAGALKAFAAPADIPYLQRLGRLVTPGPQTEPSWEARRQRLLASLAEKGISGDAVHVTPDMDPQWHETRQTLARDMGSVKAEWLAALAAETPPPTHGP
uniref:Uncharacterized protein n=1 Tax=Desulfacinum infernum TaxID=35837 RepID=A0A832EIC5_9BACT